MPRKPIPSPPPDPIASERETVRQDSGRKPASLSRRLRGETVRDRDARRYLHLVALPHRTTEEQAEMESLTATLYPRP